jgi:hypothetical protein
MAKRLTENQPRNRCQKDTNANDGDWSVIALAAENLRHSEIIL